MPEFFHPDLAGDPMADARERLDSIYEFTTWVLEIVAPHAACVKFQSAYFEAFHVEGVEAYYSLVHEAQQRGLLVIGDVKRGDIGTTSAAYAKGHLTPISQDDGEDDYATPDAITISPFLGLDTIDPFIKEAAANNKGLFALVRTSNPGSAVLQDATLADGRTLSEKLADELAPIAAKHLGASGLSLIGAVVGATQPHTMHSLRARLPQSTFLLPGYGAQGATAEMTRAAFNADGLGAIVSASRSVLYAHREPKYSQLGDWRKAVERAVIDMKTDINAVLAAGVAK
jgi:orotidine-5'-phosphate decarboxylase